MGTDAAIFRTLGKQTAMRTDQYNSRWLNGELHPRGLSGGVTGRTRTSTEACLGESSQTDWPAWGGAGFLLGILLEKKKQSQVPCC